MAELLIYSAPISLSQALCLIFADLYLQQAAAAAASSAVRTLCILFSISLAFFPIQIFHVIPEEDTLLTTLSFQAAVAAPAATDAAAAATAATGATATTGKGAGKAAKAVSKFHKETSTLRFTRF